MARKTTYDKRQLSVACSKLKTQILKKIEQSQLSTEQVTKTFVFNELSKKLNLTSSSSFWKPSFKYKEYLEDWYSNLDESLKERASKSQPEVEITTTTNKVCSGSNSSNLSKEVKEKNDIIDSLLAAINTLRIENESLRLARLSRLGYIDNAEILNEEIDDAELEKLYKIITKLYESRKCNVSND